MTAPVRRPPAEGDGDASGDRARRFWRSTWGEAAKAAMATGAMVFILTVIYLLALVTS